MVSPTNSGPEVSQTAKVTSDDEVHIQPIVDEKSIRVKTMGELKEKAPKVYNETMKGIAQTIMSESKKAVARMKKIIREGLQN